MLKCKLKNYDGKKGQSQEKKEKNSSDFTH